MSRQAYRASRIVPCANQSTAPHALPAIDDGAIVIDGDRITWIGPFGSMPSGIPCHDFGRALLTPGLVDAHTHAAWIGSRHEEYAMRLAGDDYQAIAKRGGGIIASHRAIRDASEDAIAQTLAARLARMAELGVTTCEVKSGYGLEPELELRQLRAIARCAADPTLPAIVPTFLGLHALAPGRDRDRYVDEVVGRTLPEIAESGLADFVDAYVDNGAFTAAEAEKLGRMAKRLGLGVRLHVGQFSDIGGAELAADLGAKSADHLEHLSPAGAKRMAECGVSGVLLPVASWTLGQSPPPVALLKDAGVSLVVASDANPGTAPTESLPLAMAMAVRSYGLSVQDAWLGATSRAARALEKTGVGDARPAPPSGVLTTNARADFVVWDFTHEAEIVQPWGVARTRLVIRGGRAIGGREAARFGRTPGP